ncbi:unnamed protein product [Heterobilharzia americana]|nr:unnamed protein product [Heterobilharzia americana]
MLYENFLGLLDSIERQSVAEIYRESSKAFDSVFKTDSIFPDHNCPKVSQGELLDSFSQGCKIMHHKRYVKSVPRLLNISLFFNGYKYKMLSNIWNSRISNKKAYWNSNLW